MNYSTVVSIVPFKIDEWKPGIYPGFFEIPACQNSDYPTIFRVGESVFHVEIDENRSITVRAPSDQVAHSLVYDYAISCLAADVEKDIGPGIFWVSGEHDLPSILKNFPNELKRAKDKQHNWFISLIKMADDDWEKTGQHKMISDLQRYAAKTLNMERPWLITSKELGIDSIKCIACQSIIPSRAIICPVCKLIIDMDKWKTLSFAEVK